MPLVDELTVETPPGQPNVRAQFFTPLGTSSGFLSDGIKQHLLDDVVKIPPGQHAKLGFHFTTESGWIAALATRGHTSEDGIEWAVHVWAGQSPQSGFNVGAGGSLIF